MSARTPGRVMPPPAAARQRRAEVLRDTRRGLIVEAAKSIFASEGLEGASMRAIAAAAGCTTGAIYPHFAGKEEIYAAVLSDSLAALDAYVARRMARQDDTSVAAKAGLQAFFDYYRGRPDELSLGLYLFRGLKPAGLNPALDKALNRQLRGIFDRVEECLHATGADDPSAETAAGIAQAVGLLVLEQTGRIKLFGKTARSLFGVYLGGRAQVSRGTPPGRG